MDILLFLFGRPVVQVMSDIMAIATLRETLMHGLGMRQAMAISTLGHCLVLGGVTGRTGNLAVLSLACGKRCKS